MKKIKAANYKYFRNGSRFDYEIWIEGSLNATIVSVDAFTANGFAKRCRSESITALHKETIQKFLGLPEKRMYFKFK